MRILSLGVPLPDSQIDNYNWASALSFFDYDAIVVDPLEAVSRMIEGVALPADSYLTYTDEPVADGPSTASVVGLADLLRRRREETVRLLARGGVVVVYGYPDAAHPHVAGFTGAHRYYWLPAPAGKDYGPAYLKPASGLHVNVVDYQHPFADYLERQRSNVLYRVVFAEGAAGFGSGSKVFGRSPGGAAIAIEIAMGAGRIVFLPALPPDLSTTERSETAGALVRAIRNTLLHDAEEGPPSWLADYPLPGIDDARGRMTAAESRIEELEAELDAARNDYRGIDRYRRLIWQEGKYGLDLPVRDAFVLLGFTSLAIPDDPATFSFGGEAVFVETEASPHAVGMDPHYRLRQRIEAKIARDGERPRGIVVVNGFRMMPPDDRAQQYDNALRVAAESMRYCVVESSRLFEAVRAHMEGSGDSGAFCRSLIETEGAFPPPDAAGTEAGQAEATPLGEEGSTR